MAADALGLIGIPALTRLPGLTQPKLSAAGTGTIYFDESSEVFKVSENGSVYVNLLGGGITPDARVFRWDVATAWVVIYAEILAHGGTGIVMVEPDGAPRIVTAGAANLDNVVFIGEPVSPDTSVAIDMNDGVVLGPGGGLRSKDILWRSLCVATRIIASGPPCSFVFDGGGMIGWTDPSATNPIRLDPGGCKIRLTNSATLSGAGMPAGNPLVVVSGGGSLDITALAGSSIGDHTLGGGLFASALVTSDASVTLNPTLYAGFIGVTFAKLDAADRVTYDDSLVTPPTLGSDNVQGALDALKSLIIAPLSVVTKSSNDTLLVTDAIVLVNTSGGAFTLTLPDPALFSGRLFYIFDKTGSLSPANALTLARFAAEKIVGLAASKMFQTAWGAWIVTSDGTDWYVL